MRSLSPLPSALRGATTTVLCMCGTVALSFVSLFLLNRLLPGLAERAGPQAFPIALAAGGAIGGYLWGGSLGRSVGRERLARAGALGFGASLPLAGLALTRAESGLLLLAQNGVAFPMHLVFGILFSAATLGVVLVTAGSLGLALGGWRTAARLALPTGVLATLAFAGVALAFDSLGWRVGAPGAEQRATMLVVWITGSLVSALAGGAALGTRLAREAGAPSPRPVLGHERPGATAGA